MLSVSVETLGGLAILRCQGRIAAGDENIFWAMLSRTGYDVLVLDLGLVSGIDAGGLGALLGLRAWTRSSGIQLRLINVRKRILQVLEVTNLDRVFEISCEKGLVERARRDAVVNAVP